jgi:hypothetical protein
MADMVAEVGGWRLAQQSNRNELIFESKLRVSS